MLKINFLKILLPQFLIQVYSKIVLSKRGFILHFCTINNSPPGNDYWDSNKCNKTNPGRFACMKIPRFKQVICFSSHLEPQLVLILFLP